MEWNEERVAALARLWREGLSASQVARRLGGVTRNAVIGKAHRLGLTMRDAPSRPNLPGAKLPGVKLAKRPQSEPRAPSPPPRVAPMAPRTIAAEVAPTATLLSLDEDGCRWPIGDPARPDFGFCGRTRNRGRAYCAEHAPRSTEAAKRRKPG